MVIGSPVAGGALRACAVAGCVVMLASCSPVTYGTGVGATKQTVQDITGILDFGRRDVIAYEPRSGLQNPTSNTLPPPIVADESEPDPAAATAATPPINLTTEQQASCALARSRVAPPPDYCIANPDAPAVTIGEGGLLDRRFRGDAVAAIRTPVDPCAWWQLAWSELKADEQEAMQLLGWSSSSWAAADPTLWPVSANSQWDDLDARSRRAAKSLSFEEPSWNLCSTSV